MKWYTWYYAAMLSIPVPFGQFADVSAQGEDSLGNLQALSALTANLSDADYASAYVQSTNHAGQFVCVSKSTPPAGGSTTVLVTLQSKDLEGNALPDLPIQVVFAGPDIPPPPPALATQLVVVDQSTISTATFPGNDPGVPTAPLHLS